MLELKKKVETMLRQGLPAELLQSTLAVLIPQQARQLNCAAKTLT